MNPNIRLLVGWYVGLPHFPTKAGMLHFHATPIAGFFLKGLTRPNMFASWLFYDNEQSYTPVLTGPVINPDSSSYYKVNCIWTLLAFKKFAGDNIYIGHPSITESLTYSLTHSLSDSIKCYFNYDQTRAACRDRRSAS